MTLPPAVIGYAGVARNVAEARAFVEAVRALGRNVANSTHVISAFRLASGEQQRDDDGEGGAGDKVRNLERVRGVSHSSRQLLHLLDVLDARDVVVVVVRWYGGIQLGPDRFRLISDAAQQAIELMRAA